MIGNMTYEKEKNRKKYALFGHAYIILQSCLVYQPCLTLFFFFLNFWTCQEEQECILKSKEERGEDKGLNWEDAKKMPITSRVIQETLRVASILSFTFREAVEDVEYQGQ